MASTVYDPEICAVVVAPVVVLKVSIITLGTLRICDGDGKDNA